MDMNHDKISLESSRIDRGRLRESLRLPNFEAPPVKSRIFSNNSVVLSLFCVNRERSGFGT